jgi:dienelactone hydrolase
MVVVPWRPGTATAFQMGAPEERGVRVAQVQLSMSNGGRTALAAMRARLQQPTPFAAAIALYPGCQSDTASTFYAPVLVLAGRADTVAPVRYCEAMKRSQSASAVPTTLGVYPYAPHTFDMNLPDRVVLRMRLGYDAEATADARTRVIDFLEQHGIGR